MTIDKLPMQSTVSVGVNDSQWTAAAGLRTPARSTDPLPYESRRFVSTFACLAALERFLLGAMQARSRAVLLRGGLTYPSSSQCAMVVGLMGLQ